MKKLVLWSLLLLLSIFITNAFASEEQEKMYLTPIINELDAIQPLILAAQAEQAKNTRIQVHYTQYHDSQGQLHNGLLEDVQTIKAGIVQVLNHVPMEPRVITPIQGDYIRG